MLPAQSNLQAAILCGSPLPITLSPHAITVCQTQGLTYDYPNSLNPRAAGM